MPDPLVVRTDGREERIHTFFPYGIRIFGGGIWRGWEYWEAAGYQRLDAVCSTVAGARSACEVCKERHVLAPIKEIPLGYGAVFTVAM